MAISKHTSRSDMDTIETKIPLPIVSDAVHSRVQCHKNYKEELSAALSMASDVCAALIDADEGVDNEALAEMKAIASEWIDMQQQLSDQSSALKRMLEKMQTKTAAEIGALSLPSEMHREVHLVATAAARAPSMAKTLQAFCDKTHNASSTGAQRMRGGWRADSNTPAAGNRGVAATAGGDDDDDDDVQMVGGGAASINTKCPITQKQFLQPVRNVGGCRHVYERDAIFAMLDKHKGKKGELTCPVQGCKEKVNRASCERSLSVERAVKRAASRRRDADASAANEQDDDGLDLT